eukprot:PhM_4_TR10964/c0_g1_i1/m.91223/K02731/PSMA7; 20S proteasome subunit alpha 4
MSYDRALTVFSPDGHLFQVEYAMEAVKRGTAAVGIRGKDSIVLAVERKTVSKLQDARTVRKICKVDDHMYVAFAGLLADARVLVDMARLECQNYRLNYGSDPDVGYITRHVAHTQQRYTQRGGKRPFGVSTILAGADPDGSVHVYLTEPSGISVEWKACVIGHGQKSVKEYLEAKYTDDMSQDEVVSFAIRALLEVVESGQKNIEVLVLNKDGGSFLPDGALEQLVLKLEKEREAEQEAKKKELE